MTDRRIDRYM